MTMVEPFTLNTNPGVRRADAEVRSTNVARVRRSAWRQRVATRGPPGTASPHWNNLEIMDAPHSGRRATRERSRAEQQPSTVRQLTTHARRTRPAPAHQDGDRERRRRRYCDAAHLRRLHARPIRCRRTRRSAVRRRDAHRSARCVGARPRRADAGASRPQADAGAGGSVRSPIAACCASARMPTWSCSTQTTIAPGPVRRVRDFPADGERLTADQPTGIHQVIVNGRTIVADGKLDERAVAARPGVWVAPSPR